MNYISYTINTYLFDTECVFSFKQNCLACLIDASFAEINLHSNNKRVCRLICLYAGYKQTLDDLSQF